MNRFKALRVLTVIFSFAFLINSSSVQAQQQSSADLYQSGLVEQNNRQTGWQSNNSPISQPAQSFSGVQMNPVTTGSVSSSSETSTVIVPGAWRNIRPTESYLFGVSILEDMTKVDCSKQSHKKGWVVGKSGVILGYCQGVWEHVIGVESIPTNLFGVQALEPDLAVAVGKEGTILRYTYDTIAQDWVWTKHPIPVTNSDLNSVSMVSNGDGSYTGWAVGMSDTSGKGVLVEGSISPRGTDPETYDVIWINRTNDFPDLPQVDWYYGLQMLSPANGWASGGRDGEIGVILHWDGIKWSVFQELGTNALHGLRFINATDGWTVGRGGEIFHFNGSHWSAIPSPTTEMLLDVDFAPDGTVWTVGYNNALLKYKDGKWSLFQDIRTDPLDYRALDFNDDHGWLVGFHSSRGIGGHILEYEDGLWLPVTTPTDNRLNAVAAISENNAWAVGMADAEGGTIIHWDGRHWQRWYQRDLPLPPANLYAIDMISATDGWAAGDPLIPGGRAVFLRWDGQRWYDRPFVSVNVRVNDLSLLKFPSSYPFLRGWAVADNGNAVARWDGSSDYWDAPHTCYGTYYQLRGVSIVNADPNPVGDWHAWAVGRNLDDPLKKEYILRFSPGCAGSNAWQIDRLAPSAGQYYSIQMTPNSTEGYIAGTTAPEGGVALISSYDGVDWSNSWSSGIRSKLYTVDISTGSDVGWFGGYYVEPITNIKKAYILYCDNCDPSDHANPPLRMFDFLPSNGPNIYHRPILGIAMVSDTMGWAVGEAEDPRDISVLYEYPYPNFILEAQPTSRAVLPGNSASYTIKVISPSGFIGDVNLEVQDLPPNVSADITPPIINADTSATVQIDTGLSTPLGKYEIQLIGTGTFRSGDNEMSVERTVPLHLTVTENPVYLVSPTSGPSGTHVSISGSGFGSDPGAGNRSTTSNHVILAGQQMPDQSVISWTDSQIQVSVPDDPGRFPHGPVLGFVKVRADNSDSNDDISFQLENYLSGITVQDMGTYFSVTINGTSLGNDPGARSTSWEHVSLDGIRFPNNQVLIWSNNAITIRVPYGTPGGQITVTSNGYESNYVTFDPPWRLNYLPLIIK